MRKEELLCKEFVGMKVQAKREQLEGVIVEETKYTFKLKVRDEVKTVLKKGNMFLFHDNQEIISIAGEDMLVRPEDRIKDTVKSWKKKQRTSD
jgi:RNase P/RNase MRP subunit p29